MTLYELFSESDLEAIAAHLDYGTSFLEYLPQGNMLYVGSYIQAPLPAPINWSWISPHRRVTGCGQEPAHRPLPSPRNWMMAVITRLDAQHHEQGCHRAYDEHDHEDDRDMASHYLAFQLGIRTYGCGAIVDL